MRAIILCIIMLFITNNSMARGKYISYYLIKKIPDSIIFTTQLKYHINTIEHLGEINYFVQAYTDYRYNDMKDYENLTNVLSYLHDLSISSNSLKEKEEIERVMVLIEYRIQQSFKTIFKKVKNIKELARHAEILVPNIKNIGLKGYNSLFFTEY